MLSEEDFGEPDEPPEPEELLGGGDDDDINDDDDENEGDDMVIDDSTDEEDFVEFDPSGRYGRYAEVLGKGAMKTVYRGYDMADCKEVAWNKARPPIECSEEQASAVQREIQILQGLHHQGIIKLYGAWIDVISGDANFITELCSTTLLDYRLKHKHISRKAVKSWGRQILKGLVHLHMQDPPIIHRDLKCENIFVKCRSNTTLKIGDFGSATYLDETHHMHTLVGTPEFMAPEMFQEDYNELVDIYSFGMCILELLTRECPYSECKSLGQIYKKVINGEMPKALHKVTDIQALRLINRCLLPVGKRPSASELLADPFLQCHEGHDGSGQSMKSSASMPNLRVLATNIGVKNMLSGQGVINKLSRPSPATRKNLDHMGSADPDPLFEKSTDNVRRKALCTKSPSFRRSYRVMGRVEDQYTLRLKIRIQESSRSCDIDFPFDLRFDSPRSVAEEMVRTLDYSDADLATIADLIREEIATLAPKMEERYALHPSIMNLQELCQSKESLDAGLSNNQSSNMSNEMLLSCENYGSAEEKAFRGSSDDNACMGKVNMCSDKSSVLLHSVSEKRERDDSVFLESNLIGEGMPLNSSFYTFGTDEQPTFVSSAITKIVSLDGPRTPLATDWNECKTSSSNTDVAPTSVALDGGSDVAVSDENGASRRKNRLDLFGSRHAPTSPPHTCSKGNSKIKQLPAGIGILLRPSTEQTFRRALPSCINASA